MYTKIIVILFTIALVLAWVFTPLMKIMAGYIGALDVPDKRKVHQEITPRLGGVGIFLSCVTTLLIGYVIFPEISLHIDLFDFRHLLLALAFALVVTVGAVDDAYELSAGKKFIFQFLCATLIYFTGYEISNISGITDTQSIALGYLDYPLTVLWIIGITNAFNLIDGLDGLATGIAIISGGTIFTISILQGEVVTAFFIIILIGALAGFLFYNYQPASIFMGDSGSLFIGFCLSVISMHSSTKSSTAFSMIIPVMVLGFPIIDTLLSMVRRFIKSLLKIQKEDQPSYRFSQVLKRIFLPDKYHIHHQLIGMGFSQQSTVLILYLISGIYGIGAIAIYETNRLAVTLLILLLSTVITFYGIRTLKYREIQVFKNGFFLNIYRQLILKSASIKRLIDIIFVFAAFYLSYAITDTNLDALPFEQPLLMSALLAGGLQYVLLYAGGLYRENIRRLGIGDLIKLLKITGFAVFGSCLLFGLISENGSNFYPLLFLIDLYLLLSLVVGIRVFFHILNYLYRKHRSSTLKVIIYGAGEQGQIALQSLLTKHYRKRTVVGFIHDDPDMKGQYINGYKILGTHWQLNSLLNKQPIDEILITTDQLKTENYNRVQKLAEQFNVKLRKINFNLQELQYSPIDNQKSDAEISYA